MTAGLRPVNRVCARGAGTPALRLVSADSGTLESVMGSRAAREEEPRDVARKRRRGYASTMTNNIERRSTTDNNFKMLRAYRRQGQGRQARTFRNIIYYYLFLQIVLRADDDMLEVDDVDFVDPKSKNY